MSFVIASKSQESVFQNDIINQMIANGWLLGTPDGYNRELALYEEDVLGFVKETQDEQWQKYRKLYPQNPEKHLLEKTASQLKLGFNRCQKANTSDENKIPTGAP
mgnify:CR=1 FL=1